MYRLLVSGSREWDKPSVLGMVIVRHWIRHPDIIVVHGDAPRGADRMARDFCNRFGVPQEKHPADWDKYGKAAGHKRNKEMVDTNPDFAVFFFEGESKGTTGCHKLAVEAGIQHHGYGRECCRT